MSKEELQGLTKESLIDKVTTLQKEIEEEKKRSTQWFGRLTEEEEKHKATKQAIKGLANVL